VIVRPAHEQREEAVRVAREGGISLGVAAEATGLSDMRISQIQEAK
jgi:hypothetical protein